jgi:hypothetical protein
MMDRHLLQRSSPLFAGNFRQVAAETCSHLEIPDPQL